MPRHWCASSSSQEGLQFVSLGVCNNSDTVTHSVEFDERMEYLFQPIPGYSVVNLRYPPLQVLIYVKSADDAGLQLDHLPRVVIAVAPVEKTFTITGLANGQELCYPKEPSVSHTAGCLSSIYRSQGHTLAYHHFRKCIPSSFLTLE